MFIFTLHECVKLCAYCIGFVTITEREISRRLDNIRMDLGEVGRGDVAQDRNRWRALVNSVLNLRVP
jgi:hypothetical protein